MEYETIDPDFLVPGNAHSFKQILLITQCAYGGHEPAITVPSLANIICGHAIDVEVRLIEDILSKISRSEGGYSSMGPQGSCLGLPQSV